MQPEERRPQDHQDESLDQFFERLNLESEEEESADGLIECLRGLKISVDPGQLTSNQLATAIMETDGPEVLPYLFVLRQRLKNCKNEVCEMFMHQPFLDRLYRLLTTNASYPVQLKALQVFSSLSSASKPLSRDLRLVPIVERAFEIVKTSKDVDALKDAFRLIGNLVGNQYDPANDLFYYSELLISIISQNWCNISIVDYASWTLSNLWSFEKAFVNYFQAYVKIYSARIISVVGQVLVSLSAGKKPYSITIWVCLEFLQHAISAISDYYIFDQQGLLMTLALLLNDRKRQTRIRNAALLLLLVFSRKASPEKKGVDLGLIQLLDTELVEASNKSMTEKICLVLAYICQDSVLMARKLAMSPSLIERLKTRLGNPHTSASAEMAYVKVICSPIYSLPPQELLQMCAEYQLPAYLLNHVMNNCRMDPHSYMGSTEEYILNATHVATRKLAFFYTKSNSHASRVFCELQLILYMVSACSRHHEAVDLITKAILEEVRKFYFS